MNILDNEIHFWLTYDHKIKNTALLNQYHRILNEEEQLQKKRFQFEKHRHQYLVTRAMLRYVLSLYDSTIKPDEWQFKKNKYGKPYIGNANKKIPLQFNLSHSEGIIILAITNGREVGVDVEWMHGRNSTLEIAQSFFSPIEIAQLIALPTEHQQNRFFDLWTLKEAYIKACGMGLSIPLDQFTFSFSEQDSVTISFEHKINDQPALWNFWRIHANDTHKIALGLKKMETAKRYALTFRNIVPMQEVNEVEYRYYPNN